MIAETILAILTAVWLAAFAVADALKAHRRRHAPARTPARPGGPLAYQPSHHRTGRAA